MYDQPFAWFLIAGCLLWIAIDGTRTLVARYRRRHEWACVLAVVDAARDDIDNPPLPTRDAAELAAFHSLADLDWSKP